jgi:ribonuclease HI
MSVVIVFISPQGIAMNFSYRLEFMAMNNIVEYEALLLGLKLALEMGIKVLQVIGDSDFIVFQVKDQYVAKNEGLRRYRHVIWGMVKYFFVCFKKFCSKRVEFLRQFSRCSHD